MAITLIQTPQAYQPAYNTIAFTVDSTNSAQCNFRYLCDVYINGTFVTRLTQFPFGSNGYATFKVNRIIEDYVTWDLHKDLYGFAVNPNSICRYVLKFGEEYDASPNCDAGTTVYPDLAVTSTFLAWNAAIQYSAFPSFDFTDWQLNSSTSDWLATNPQGLADTQQNPLWIGENTQSTTNFLNTVSGRADYAEIKTYDSTGALIGTYQVTNPFATISGATPVSHNLLTFGVGPDNLNNTTLSSGVQPVITNAVDTYSVTLWDTTGPTQRSKSRWFKIDYRCTKWVPITFWWLNILGGFDTYTFTQQATRTTSITRDNYSKLFGGITGSPPEWTYEVGDRGTVTSSVNGVHKYSARSNWITEPTSWWMENLFASPEAYMNLPGTPIEWTPITITSSNFDLRVKNNVKNIDYVVQFDESNAINIQRN